MIPVKMKQTCGKTKKLVTKTLDIKNVKIVIESNNYQKLHQYYTLIQISSNPVQDSSVLINKTQLMLTWKPSYSEKDSNGMKSIHTSNSQREYYPNWSYKKTI